MIWEEVEIGAVANVLPGFAFKSAHLGNEGTPVVKIGNITDDGGVNLADVQKLPNSHLESKHERFRLVNRDILLAMTGATAGKVGRISAPDGAAFLLNQRVAKIEPKAIDPDFFWYVISTRAYRERFFALGGGAAQPNMSGQQIASIKIPFPPNPVQQKIAGVLSVYNDLMENNRRRIALLEAAAQLLYREWFVHFRFPGHEQLRITEGLPEGWQRVRIEQVLIALESGGRPRGGALESDGIPSIGAENVIGLGQYDYAKEKYVPENYFAKMRRGVIQSRDVMLYKDGAHIGRCSMFGDGFPHSQCAVNEHVFILRVDVNVGQSYLYFWLSQPETCQSVVNLNASTAQPGISQDKLKTLWFVLPPEALRHLFNESVEAQVAQIFRLALMNQKLAEARDLLLPRLMNREIVI